MLKKLMAFFAISFAAALLGGAPTQAQEVTLRFDSWIPKHFINTQFLPKWVKEVEKATEGRVKIKIGFPPKVPPPTLFDRVKDGVGDMAWGIPAYTPGRFVLTEIAELPFLDAPSSVVSVAYWRTHVKFLAKANEYAGVKLVAVSVTTPGILHTKFPVNSISDLKGKKFRVPGGVAGLIAKRVGIVGVHAPAPKVYEMLQQGVIEGVFMPPETSNSFKLKEVTTNMTVIPGGLYMSAFFLIINPDAFAKMSKKDQAAFMRASGENASRIWGKIWDEQDPPAIKSATESHGVKFGTANAELSAALHEKLADFHDLWVARANKKGIDGKAALAYMKAEIKKLKGQ